MRKSALALTIVCALAVAVQAIGFQHGLFRSQSTQGEAWQGTAKIVDEHYDITVHPDYLDVELTWVFEANGTQPQEHADALEIVGNINFVEHSVVVGMITWWQDKILKGKLKTNEVARQEYEDVVERDSDAPPPPRDPVLLEWIRQDNYDISIFPVEFGKTRKLRIRYLIPAFQENGVNKIVYPHAYTPDATVSIKNAESVEGYTLETTKLPVFFDRPVILDSDAYSLQAYGGRNRPMISHIVPHLADTTDGSVMYVGGFSAEDMSGEMTHLTTMSGREALLRTPIAQDFVILWRWNHPGILEKYAAQIVAQSKLLITFLEKLETAKKQAALIIAKEGGEQITFQLDGPGGTEFNRMLSYLNELASQEVVDPPHTTQQAQPTSTFDRQQAMEEFEQTLKAAMEIFESSEASLKHLLLLTAGPQLIYQTTQDLPAIEWDQAIDIGILSSYVQSQSEKGGCYPSSQQLYWPGINLRELLDRHSHGILVTATVGNEAHSHTLEALSAKPPADSYRSPTATTQAHLYSSSALDRKITWVIHHNEQELARFEETPRVVPMAESIQYARLIGSSAFLTPLADRMPSSLASTLGFIDEKYALVALEEDALPEEIAARYEQSGVPLLASQDIFPAGDEVADMPVADWLAVNPPKSLQQPLYQAYYTQRLWLIGDEKFTDVPVVADFGGVVDANAEKADGAARLATPQVQTIAALESGMQPDYTAAAVTDFAQNRTSLKGDISLMIRKGSLMVDLSSLNTDQHTGLTIVLYDLKGRVIQIWRPSLREHKQMMLPLKQGRLAHGTYLVRVRGVNLNFTQRILIK